MLATVLAAITVVPWFFNPKRLVQSAAGAGWPWYAWLAALGLSALFGSDVDVSALLLVLLPLPLYVAARTGLLPAVPLAQVLLAASAVESAIVVLQFFSLDPLLWLGWHPEQFPSPRMRCYGTFGNPNFVAAWLAGTLPLYAGRLEDKHRVWWAAAALQVSALLACGSRAPVLALFGAGVTFAVLGGPARKWLVASVAVSVLLVSLSLARPLKETIRGRMALSRITVEHVLEIPPAGYGPGSFVVKYSEWQIGWLRSNHAPKARRFVGPLDHAHNDYLEFWVDCGPLGLAAFTALVAWLMAGTARRAAATAAGAAALLAVALVDFPFHRPGEWVLFWLLLGTSVSRSAPDPGAYQKGRGENVAHP